MTKEELKATRQRQRSQATRDRREGERLAGTLVGRMHTAAGKRHDKPEVINLFDALMDEQAKDVLEQAYIEVSLYGKVTLSFENGKVVMINKSVNIKPGGGK